MEITREEAKKLYCSGKNVYVTTNNRTHWKLPASYEYGSHAPVEELFNRSIPKPVEELFNRSIPKYEGEVKFYKDEPYKTTTKGS